MEAGCSFKQHFLLFSLQGFFPFDCESFMSLRSSNLDVQEPQVTWSHASWFIHIHLKVDPQYNWGAFFFFGAGGLCIWLCKRNWHFTLVKCCVLLLVLLSAQGWWVIQIQSYHVSIEKGHPNYPDQNYHSAKNKGIRVLISSSLSCSSLSLEKGAVLSRRYTSFCSTGWGVSPLKPRSRLDTWTETLLLNLRRQLEKVQKDVWGLGFPVYS